MFPKIQKTSISLAVQLASSKITSTNTGEAGKAFMKFAFETGYFTFGRDGVDITGDEIIINTESVTWGWTLWSGGKPTKIKVPFTEDLPPPMDAIGQDYPTEARSFDARFEDDKDTLLDFSTNSMGGRKGVDSMLDAVKLRSAGGEEIYLYPVVRLESESYANAKRGGKLTFNPVFTIVDWVDYEGKRESATPKLEVVETEGETPEVETPEVEKEAPKVKRRRRKS